jgi:hypothetical protein
MKILIDVEYESPKGGFYDSFWIYTKNNKITREYVDERTIEKIVERHPLLKKINPFGRINIRCYKLRDGRLEKQ